MLMVCRYIPDSMANVLPLSVKHFLLELPPKLAQTA